MSDLSVVETPLLTRPAGLSRSLEAVGIGGHGLAVAAVTVAGLLPRLIRLGQQPVWRDEAFTAVVAQRSTAAMLAAVSHDSHPPLSFLLVHLLGGGSALSLRLGSALAGALAIPLAAALARRAAGDRAALVAAGLVAVAPSELLLSRDARMYSLALTLVLATALTLWRAVERPDPGRLLAFAATAALAAYTHYFAALAVAILTLAALAVLRPPWRTAWRLLAAAGVAALSLVPWLIAARAQFQHRGFWVPPPNLGSVTGMLADPLAGQPVAHGATPGWLISGAVDAALLVGLLAFVALLSALRRPGSDGPRPASPRRALAYLAIPWPGMVTLLLALSLYRPIFDPRYASVAWGPPLVLLGIGLSRLRPAWATAALAVLAASGLALALTQQNPDFQPLAQRLDASLRPGDLVVIGTPRAYFPLVHYLRPELGPQVHMVSVKPVSWFWGTAGFLPGAVIPAVPDPPAGEVWVLLENGEHSFPSLPEGVTLHHTLCSDAGCLLDYSP